MATSTTHVIQYVGDLTDIKNKLKEIDRINKVISKQFGKDFTRATDIVSRNLDKISTRPITLKGGKKATEELRRFTTVIKTTDGTLKTLTETQRRVNGAIKSTNVSIRNGANVSRSFGANLKTLLTRASLTIPVWFALRRSVGAVFRTIKDGLKDLVDFDRALQKLRRNVSATSTNLEKDFRNITDEIEKFSRESGVNVEEITRAIQRFATVGFDVETSLKGGIQATKLAVNLFGDAEETANAFARSLRVLTVDIENSEERQRAIAEALALTDQLWQTNAFEVSEFSNNLEKFAGTAKIANLSIEDTLTLLATLSTAGISGRSGRLLRSTLLRALADFENINRELGLGLDPDETPTIEFVLKLVQALKELRATENLPAELTETLADLFTIRGTEVLAGLTALEKVLKENIALEPDLAKFNETFEELSNTTNRLVARFNNLNKEISRAFVTGLVGGKDFEDSLQKILSAQEATLDNAIGFGEIINAVFTRGGFTGDIFARNLRENIDDKITASADVAGEKAQEVVDNINKAFRGNLDFKAIEDLINTIEVFGSAQLGIDQATLERVVERLNIELLILEAKKGQVVEDKKGELTRKKNKEISEAILKNQLDSLKAQGAIASQIISAEIALRNQLGIQGDIVDQVERQLQKERELTEEQRLRSELGNDTIKLFRIAQTEGIAVAQRIGEVLSGELDFSQIVRRGGTALEVFEREFANLAEQQRALAFFRGERVPGTPGLRGGGRIPIEEEALRRRGTRIFDPGVAIAQERAERLAQRIEADIRVDSRLEVNVFGLIGEDIGDKIRDGIIRELQNPESEFSKQLDRRINAF